MDDKLDPYDVRLLADQAVQLTLLQALMYSLNGNGVLSDTECQAIYKFAQNALSASYQPIIPADVHEEAFRMLGQLANAHAASMDELRKKRR